MNKREVGTRYEELVVRYLANIGYHIIECNYRCRFGEIDIIAEHQGYLTFIEVKYRKTKKCGGAKSAVSIQKQKTICKVASFYMISKQLLDNTPCRFDVVAVEGEVIEVIANAFYYVS